MITVQAFRARTLDVDRFELSWRIEDTQDDVFDYTFQVFRSEGPAGPWDALSPPFQDQYVFYDRIVRSFHLARQYNYKLLVTNKITGDFVEIGPIDTQPEADLIAQEIRRHMHLLFREFTGRRCWVLPVRTFGQRCSCWNAKLSKRTRSGCRLCYDTGFVRGYMNPIETWVQIDPGSNLSEQNTNVGPLQQVNTTARLVNVGGVKPRDLIIEPENRRWRVVQINQTEQSRSPIHLELQIHEIPASDVEYSIELDLDRALKDIWLSPSRNFTNPQNLETFKNEEIPTIFNLYDSTYTDPNK